MHYYYQVLNQATGYAGQHIWYLSQAGYIGRVAAGRESGVIMGYDGGGLLISPDGVAPSRIVGVSASIIFPCTILIPYCYFCRHSAFVASEPSCTL